MFDPIQRQVASHLAAHDEELLRFRLALFSHYLSSPAASLAFPSTCSLPSQPVTPPSLPCLPLQYVPTRYPPHPRSRTMFTPVLWDKLVATPYGRYNTEQSTLSEADRGRIEEGLREAVRKMGWEEYAVVSDSKEAYRQHFGEKGVRIVGGGKTRGAGYNIVTGS